MHLMKWTFEEVSSFISPSIQRENLESRVLPTCSLLLLGKRPSTISRIQGRTLSWFFYLNPSISYLTLHWLWRIVNLFLWILSKRRESDLPNLLSKLWMMSESLNCWGIVRSLIMENRESLPEIISMIFQLVGGLMELSSLPNPSSRRIFISLSKTYWLQSLSSFSLVKLMQNCSKLLTSKFSNPKISRMLIELYYFLLLGLRDCWILCSTNSKIALQIAFDRVLTFVQLFVLLQGLRVNSFRNFFFSNNKIFYSSTSTTPSLLAIFSISSLLTTVHGFDSSSLLTLSSNSMFPNSKMQHSRSHILFMSFSQNPMLFIELWIYPKYFLSCTPVASQQLVRDRYLQAWAPCIPRVPLASRQQNIWYDRSLGAALTTLDFYRRQLLISAPAMVLSVSKKIWTYLPKRLELSLRRVLLFPKASSTGLQAKILASMGWLSRWLREVRSCIQYLVDSVLPAPLSPEMTMACFFCWSIMEVQAFPAIKQIWGFYWLVVPSMIRPRMRIIYSWLKNQGMSRQGLMIMSVGPISVKIWLRLYRCTRLFKISGSFRMSISHMSSQASPADMGKEEELAIQSLRRPRSVVASHSILSSPRGRKGRAFKNGVCCFKFSGACTQSPADVLFSFISQYYMSPNKQIQCYILLPIQQYRINGTKNAHLLPPRPPPAPRPPPPDLRSSRGPPHPFSHILPLSLSGGSPPRVYPASQLRARGGAGCRPSPVRGIRGSEVGEAESGLASVRPGADRWADRKQKFLPSAEG